MRCLWIVALAACGDNMADEDAIPFANLDDGSIDRLALAATGSDVVDAIRRISTVDHTSTCPHVEITDAAITFTGGCRTADGDTYEGVARITATGYELEHFTITNAIGARRLFDGTIRGTEMGFDADVFVGQGSRLVRSELRRRCDDDRCTNEGLLELVDVGTARVSSQFGVGRVNDFAATLRGGERVELYPELRSLSACVVWRVVGTDRVRTMFCSR